MKNKRYAVRRLGEFTAATAGSRSQTTQNVHRQ